MRSLFRVFAISIGFAILASGCAHAPLPKGIDPKEFFDRACGATSPGLGVASLKGSVWLKANSKEASGQFPAVLEVQGPEKLRMEVTNLIGSTEAVIRIEGNRYIIDVPASKKTKAQKEEGADSWGGIPLRWATQLFLGRVPCPPAAATRDMKLSLSPAGDELVVETKASLEREPQVFTYRFRNWDGHPWPEALHWERKGTLPLSVDFKFDDPESGTRSPRKWEAKSPMGEVKVRWRDREH